LTEAVNLYAASLRAHKLLRYDAATMKITNVPDANKYLTREYRSGWGPDQIANHDWEDCKGLRGN
jgi:hypothetical protein